jgi:hypothetical protein
MKAAGILRTGAYVDAPQQDCQVIASFGAARLVKKPDGKIELIGGTAEDNADALDWCSLLAHDVVFTWAPEGIHPGGSAA